MNKVIYLAHYDIPDRDTPRYRSAPACAKIDYISKTIADLGYDIELLSASNTLGDGCSAEEISVSPNFIISFLKGFKRRKNKLSRICSTVLFNINLLFNCLKKVKKNDTLIVYHSLALMWLVKIVKLLKSPKLILEVEEIYADVLNNAKTKKRELSYFKIADSYLFCSDVLDGIVNTDKKPSAVIYGTYQVEEDRNVKRNDGKIHLLYAGTFSKQKGVMTAINLASNLPSNYHIHILGKSSTNVLANINKIVSHNNKTNHATVTYDGFLSGEDYIRFVQSCDIGLSPQNSNTTFNETSFPSKVLSYLSNGLRVVSVKLDPLEQSSISHLLYYYEGDSIEKLAETVQLISFLDPYDSRVIVDELDEKFRKAMDCLLRSR